MSTPSDRKKDKKDNKKMTQEIASFFVFRKIQIEFSLATEGVVAYVECPANGNYNKFVSLFSFVDRENLGRIFVCERRRIFIRRGSVNGNCYKFYHPRRQIALKLQYSQGDLSFSSLGQASITPALMPSATLPTDSSTVSIMVCQPSSV